MKSILIALSISSLAVLTSCQAAQSGTSAANSPTNRAATGANTNTVASSSRGSQALATKMSKEEADAARGVSLDDIDTSRPMPADQLKKGFIANASDWKGKKVVVSGAFSMYMTSSSVLDGSSAYRTQVKGVDKEPAVACLSKTKPKEEWEATQNRKDFSKDVVFVFKGVVVDMSLDHVALEPCEIVSVKEQ